MTGVFEQAEVVPRRPQEHGHLIERHTASRFVEHAADDLDRLAAFARRREQADVARLLALRRPLDGEDMTPQVRKIRRGTRRVLDTLERRTEAHERGRRHLVSLRHGGEHRGRSRCKGRNEVALDRGVERHVEEHERKIGPADLAGRHGLRRQLEQGRAIVHGRVAELLFDARKQLTDVLRCGIAAGQLRGVDAGKPQLVDRARQRLRETRHRRDRREICQLSSGDGVEHCPRGHGFRTRMRGRSPARVADARSRRPRREFGQAETCQSKRRAGLARNRADEIVGRAASRTDDEGFGRGRKLLEKRTSGCEPCRRRGGRDDTQH